MPSELYEKTQAAVAEQHTTQSKFVRQALAFYLDDLEHKKLAQELREGYLANAALDLSICEEFAFADAETAD